MTAVSPLEREVGARRLRVLHVIAALGPTNAQYHEHCLPLLGQREFVLCSLLPASITPPEGVALFAGDGSRRGAWRALRAAVRSGEHDVMHAHVPVSAALLALATVVEGRSRARLVYSMTNSYLSYRRRNRLLLYAILAAFPQVVLCSESVRDTLPGPLARLARRRSTVVANGVDVARIRQVLDTASSPRSGPGLTVVSVCRLVPIKDPLAVLGAFQRACGPDDRLVFLGDGPMRGQLEAAVRAAGLEDRVEVAGVVPRDEVYRRVAQADLYVSASHGEGLPVAVLEAMACGAPVVLSDIPPHRELARHVPGLPLAEVGDEEGLAREMAGLGRLEPEQRAALGDRGRRVVEELYGVTAMHRALADVYDRASRTDEHHRRHTDG